MKKKLFAIRDLNIIIPTTKQDGLQIVYSIKKDDFVGYLVEDINFINFGFNMYLILSHDGTMLYFVKKNDVRIEELIPETPLEQSILDVLYDQNNAMLITMNKIEKALLNWKG